MAVNDTTNLGLREPDDNEKSWGAYIRTSYDRLEARLATPYNGDPNGNVIGYWLGQRVYDYANDVPYVCTTTGDAASAVWTIVDQLAGTVKNKTIGDNLILTKGGDIASASPLVIDTDGTYFDVTGTTGFSAMTVAAGAFFGLHFDGALTITDGASIDMHGNDYVTAAGDELWFFATAANTVRCVAAFPEGYSPIAMTQAQAEAGTDTVPRPVAAEQIAQAIAAQSSVVQRAYAESGAVATGTTAMVDDDTPPEKTEGDEYITLAITPTSATNRLRIRAVLNLSVSAGNVIIAGLFQDTTTNALAATMQGVAADARVQLVIQYEMVAGTTSATTFKIRAGGTSGTTTFNGTGGARKLGGVMISSVIIEEVVP